MGTGLVNDSAHTGEPAPAPGTDRLARERIGVPYQTITHAGELH